MIEVFPASSLDNSILTSVLVGLFVVWFFQERLGWGLGGLIVPGYLASVFVIQPLSGLVIVLEAVATFLIVFALSDSVPRWWPYTSLFGRDRFFLILLVSVYVRLAVEGHAIDLVEEAFSLRLSDDLHSMGLVVVPLTANALWRSGIREGFVRVGLPVFLTWFILAQVLLRFTNLSLSSFELTYEDLARDFVGSPRAYMILLTGAYLGSVANLRYGWDMGGIIVPGLLALCWLQPTRLLATVGEVLVMALLMRSIVRLPSFRSANLTGGRPLVLAFTTAYLVKFAMSWLFGALWPGFRIGELFGFGYLLPAIMAMRVVKHGEPFQSMIPSLLVSLAGFVGSSVLGYGLLVLLPGPFRDDGPAASLAEQQVAVIRLAYQDAGPVPGGLFAALRQGQSTVLSGGEGFGGLWVRETGSPLVVSTRVGTPGSSRAALALSEALDARVVHLCAPRGTACEEARAALAKALPVLVIEPSSEPAVLTAPGALPGSLDLRAVRDVVGDFRIASGPRLLLTLPPQSRWHAASVAEGIDPLPLEAVGPVREGPDPAWDRLDMAVFRDLVLDPWIAWLTGTPGADLALRAASGEAARLGLPLGCQDERCALSGGRWRAVLARDGGDALVLVPSTITEEAARPVGQAVWVALGGAALLEDEPPPGAFDPTLRPVHAVLTAALTRRKGPVVTVRGLPDGQEVASDAVLSLGRPADDEPLVELLRAPLEALGATVDVYDGSPRTLAFADPGQAARWAARAARGEEAQITLWAGTRLGELSGPWAEDGPELALARAAGVPIRKVSGPALVASAKDGPYALPRWAMDPGSPRALRSAVMAEGGSLWLGCDAEVGCRWLVAEWCAGACWGFLVAAGQGEAGQASWTAALGGEPVPWSSP